MPQWLGHAGDPNAFSEYLRALLSALDSSQLTIQGCVEEVMMELNALKDSPEGISKVRRTLETLREFVATGQRSEEPDKLAQLSLADALRGDRRRTRGETAAAVAEATGQVVERNGRIDGFAQATQRIIDHQEKWTVQESFSCARKGEGSFEDGEVKS